MANKIETSSKNIKARINLNHNIYTNSIYFPTIFSYYRGLPELKEKVANCIGLIGGNLGNEAGR